MRRLLKNFKTEINPTEEQKVKIRKKIGTCRFIYNFYLAHNKELHENGKKFTENLIKYYNYLKDFSLLSEREISEIKVWKDLLIYATLYDVADEVEKQLKKLSPEFLENYDVDIYSLHTAMIYSHVFSNNFLDAYSKSVQKSSGGGGGFTSIGGGGGSFGGGSGGGTR